MNILLLTGCFFAFVAALGTVRMPDIYCRMHAATKAGAFGLALILVALCIHTGSLRVWLQSAMILIFFYATAPIAAHMIARTAKANNARFWKPDNEVRPD